MPSAIFPGDVISITAPITPIMSTGMALMIRPVQSMALGVVRVGASVVMTSPFLQRGTGEGHRTSVLGDPCDNYYRLVGGWVPQKDAAWRQVVTTPTPL